MRSALVALLFTSAFIPQPAADRPLPFSDERWELRGDRTAIVRGDGREVLQVETGFGHRRDVQLENGTIDFEIQVTRRRSFVYLHFRAAADGEREEIYLRPHKSALPDAVQYAPVWQNSSAWQLHHGQGATAAVSFEPGVWMPVRLVLQGRHAALFISDMTTPALLVPRMSRDPRPGYIALGAFLPAGVPGEGPVARFANVTVRPHHVPFDFTSALAKAAPPGEASATEQGIIRAWSVSRSFAPNDEAMPALPPPERLREMQRLETEPGGLLQLHRHVRMPAEGKGTAALARVRVRADKPGAYAFDLGFSDVAIVFVNGQPIFRGDASYSFDRPRREGLIGFEQARLYLPLVAGENDVAVLVSDTFGGWGLMGRFVNISGLKW
jgi:hypothetical protein